MIGLWGVINMWEVGGMIGWGILLFEKLVIKLVYGWVILIFLSVRILVFYIWVMYFLFIRNC